MCPGVVVIIIMRLLMHGCLCMSSKRVNEDVCINNAYREMCWVIEECFVFFARYTFTRNSYEPSAKWLIVMCSLKQDTTHCTVIQMHRPLRGIERPTRSQRPAHQLQHPPSFEPACKYYLCTSSFTLRHQ
jgi:hypothetical protein